MYSALKDVQANSAEEAKRQCPPQFDAPNFAPAKAIRWPPRLQSSTEQEWLKTHVGDAP